MNISFKVVLLRFNQLWYYLSLTTLLLVSLFLKVLCSRFMKYLITEVHIHALMHLASIH